MTAATDTDVAIVGYGPTGATLAILLAQAGHDVVVLERQPAPYPLPRAVHFDHEVGRIFQSCGIGTALREHIEPADVYEWRNATGDVLLRIGRRGLAGSGWPVSSMFNQPALERLLDARAASLPSVQIRRGAEVTALHQHDEHLSLTTSSGDEITARYAVGCDGARSRVRDLTATPVHDLGFFYDWLIVDVLLHEPRVFDPINLQICDPARPTTVVSGGPGRRRWEFMRLPGDAVADPDDEARAWELLAPWDVNPSNAELERHADYTFHARHAERWRTRRALLAGDAAHQMPPFAGQGMCAGVRDAANLAWKLDLVLRHLAPDSLLDAYEAERLPSARAAIDVSMELGRIICVADPAEATARDEMMSAGVSDEPTEAPAAPGIASGVVHTSPHSGSVFVQGCVDGRPFDDVHGVGWRLVTVDTSPVPVSTSVAAWFGSIGGEVVSVDRRDPTFGRWFAEHAATWALQRPDFHLYGTATDAPGAARLVGDLHVHLTTGVLP